MCICKYYIRTFLGFQVIYEEVQSCIHSYEIISEAEDIQKQLEAWYILHRKKGKKIDSESKEMELLRKELDKIIDNINKLINNITLYDRIHS